MIIPFPSPESFSALVERLAEEMADGWRRGERPLTEEYLTAYPQLHTAPEAVVELIYQEFCLREDHNEAGGHDELLRRFPFYRDHLARMFAVHDLLGLAAPRLPEVGETLGDFRLLAELGRGARGRVYLAAQPALADRPVVLKVTPRDGGEHLSLARLQHTHIVPLYTAHDDADRRLRVLCMPYFGGLTLDRLLTLLGESPSDGRSGRRLVELLDREEAARAVGPPTGPTRQWLEKLSDEQAVCWIGACLAEALDHAHQRGLVHLDVKPSNVLLAADGQPMLLDFHLAQPPLSAGTPAPAWLGGTPAYMAPELRAGLDAAVDGRPLPTAIDGRADVWSLGRVLAEALSATSVGLADVLRKCQADDPGDRYATAAALAADLQRHLTDRPLRGVANRSVAERWAKWRRRRPFALPLFLLLLAVLGGVAAAGASAWENWRRQHGEAEAALREGRQHLSRRRPDDAARAFQRGLDVAAGGLFLDDVREPLSEGLRQAEQARADEERARLIDDLRRLVDQLRVLFGADWTAGSRPGAATIDAPFRELWSRRDRLTRELGEVVRGDLLDLAVLWAEWYVGRAGGGMDAARREALQVLAEAERELGPSHVLYRVRQRHAAALGLWTEAAEAERRALALPPRSAWDHYALGRELLRDRPPLPHLTSGGPVAFADGLAEGVRLLTASVHLEHAVRLQPDNVWIEFASAACAYRMGRHHDAVASLSVCVGASPRVSEFFALRSLAHAALGQAERALDDHQRACRLAAPAAGPPLAAVHYNLAVFRLNQGDRDAARTHLKLALEAGPHHNAAGELLRRLSP